MLRQFSVLSLCLMILTACGTPPAPVQLAADGKPLPTVYRISSADTATIQYRVLDSVNAFRRTAGKSPVALNANLNAAAATHALDMHKQNRPWHFGSDGSSPLERIGRAGYEGSLLGENISETYEGEIPTLAAWMNREDTRDVILNENATDLGISWFQEDRGKLWWVLLLAQRN